MNVSFVSIRLVREKTLRYETHITSPENSYKIAKEILANADKETLAVFCLDTRNRINAINIVSIGTTNSADANPREIFKAAILSNSVAIVLAHNHPSGDCKPSSNDLKITRQVAEAGRILEIELLDHIVLGENDYWSAKESRKDLFKED